GRFISEDPVKDGANWYSYCANNPLKYVDPTGLYKSNWFLRSFVPGQVQWDRALTAFGEGKYFKGSIHTATMLAEQFLFVYTLKSLNLWSEAGSDVALEVVEKVTEGTSKTTGTVWDVINPTAKNISNTNIPATFQLEVGNRTLWANANATEHMGEYIARFGPESWTIEMRSQAMLKSFNAAVTGAMEKWAILTPGRYFDTIGGWELGINTETGVIYHALMK
ncbi:MAG: hypothetical protein KAX49_19870, partial [Halanaerobiales bacterium]|nr:hypothetical protein [Halanaerobiales bacterium]